LGLPWHTSIDGRTTDTLLLESIRFRFSGPQDYPGDNSAAKIPAKPTAKAPPTPQPVKPIRLPATPPATPHRCR